MLYKESSIRQLVRFRNTTPLLTHVILEHTCHDLSRQQMLLHRRRHQSQNQEQVSDVDAVKVKLLDQRREPIGQERGCSGHCRGSAAERRGVENGLGDGGGVERPGEGGHGFRLETDRGRSGVLVVARAVCGRGPRGEGIGGDGPGAALDELGAEEAVEIAAGLVARGRGREQAAGVDDVELAVVSQMALQISRAI